MMLTAPLFEQTKKLFVTIVQNTMYVHQQMEIANLLDQESLKTKKWLPVRSLRKRKWLERVGAFLGRHTVPTGKD